MSNYKRLYTAEFESDLKTLKKHRELILRVEKKVGDILEDPCHYKPLRNILKNKRRVHIGSYVLIFEVSVEDKTVYFHSFKHHDKSYK